MQRPLDAAIEDELDESFDDDESMDDEYGAEAMDIDEADEDFDQPGLEASGVEGFADDFEMDELGAEGFDEDFDDEGAELAGDDLDDDFDEVSAESYDEDGFSDDLMDEAESVDELAALGGFDGYEDALLESLDADDDEFLGAALRVLRGPVGGMLKRGIGSLAGGLFGKGGAATRARRAVAQRAMTARRQAGPLLPRLLRNPQALAALKRARFSGLGGQLGGAAAQRLGLPPALGRAAGQHLGSFLTNLVRNHGSDGAIDGFADAMADLTHEEFDAAAPVLAALAGRHVVKKTIPPAKRMAKPAATKQVAAQAMKATQKAAKILAKKHGPKAAAPVVAKIVRKVAKVARQQKAPVKSVPRTILRAAVRVSNNRQAVRKLAKPTLPARKLRLEAAKKTAKKAMAKKLGSNGVHAASAAVV